MKSNVVNMEEEMKKLSDNMDMITKCSTEINDTLNPGREKLCELTGVHRLLKKVHCHTHPCNSIHV